MSILQDQHATDEDLIQTFKKTRDQKLLGLVYKRYTRKVLGICFSYLQDLQDSEDAVMDIFIELTEKVPKYEIINFKSWLYQLSRNHCLKKLRKSSRIILHQLSKDFEESEVEYDDIQDLEKKEAMLDQLMGAVEQLGDDQRRCIILFYFKQMSYAEITQRTGYETKKVKSALQNGRKQLYKQLSAIYN